MKESMNYKGILFSATQFFLLCLVSQGAISDDNLVTNGSFEYQWWIGQGYYQSHHSNLVNGRDKIQSADDSSNFSGPQKPADNFPEQSSNHGKSRYAPSLAFASSHKKYFPTRSAIIDSVSIFFKRNHIEQSDLFYNFVNLKGAPRRSAIHTDPGASLSWMPGSRHSFWRSKTSNWFPGIHPWHRPDRWRYFISIPGWIATEGLIEIQHGNTSDIEAFEGRAKLELDSNRNSIVKTIVDTDADEDYILSFWYSPRLEDGSDTNHASVWWSEEQIDFLMGSVKGWQYKCHILTGIDSETPIFFKGEGASDSYGALVDDVRLLSLLNIESIPADCIDHRTVENYPPVFVSEPILIANEGESYLYVLEVEDPDADALNFELLEAPSGMAVSSDGMIQWAPDFSQSGNHSVSVQVSDGQLYTIQAYELSVLNTNRAPQVENTNIELSEDSSVQIVITADDPDGDNLQWSLDSGPSYGQLDGALPNLTYIPNSNFYGDDGLSFSVSDGDLEVVGRVEILVTPVNDAPYIVSEPNLEIFRDQPYQYAVVAEDADDTNLDFSLTEAPLGMTISPFDGLISWSSDMFYDGSQSVAVTVSDVQGASNQQTFVLEVDLNRAPEILSVPRTEVYEGEQYSYQIVASDSDGDELAYEVVSGPPGMTVSELGTVSWFATEAVADLQVVLAVSDTAGKTTEQNYQLHVRQIDESSDVLGSEFWISLHQTIRINQTGIFIYLWAESDTSATLEITGLQDPIEVALVGRQFQTVDLTAYYDTILRHVGYIDRPNVRVSGSIHITSPGVVSGYVISQEDYSSDSTALTPSSAYGTEYFASAWHTGFMMIVATEDQTTLNLTRVEHTSSGKRVEYVPKTVILDAGEIYNFETVSTSGNWFAGSFVNSDKPVSAFSGSFCPFVPIPGDNLGSGPCDQLLEQLRPVNLWSARYFTNPFLSRSRGDYYLIVAAEDETYVRIDGVLVAELQHGDFYKTDIAQASVIEANRPIQVSMFGTGALWDSLQPSIHIPEGVLPSRYGDPSMIVLQGEHEYRTNYQLPASHPRFEYNYFNVVIPTDYMSSVLVDGSYIPPTTAEPIQDTGYSALRYETDIQVHIVSADVPFGLTVYGYHHEWESYGHVGAVERTEILSASAMTIELSRGQIPVDQQICMTVSVTDIQGLPVQSDQVSIFFSLRSVEDSLLNTNRYGRVEKCFDGLVSGIETIEVGSSAGTETVDIEWLPSAQVNLPPELVSFPSTYVRPTETYQEAIQAIDPEGGPLEFMLVSGPTGIQVAPNGLVTWYTEEILVLQAEVILNIVDDQGLVTQISFPLIHDPYFSRAPTLVFTPPEVVTAEFEASYRLEYTDPDGDPVNFELVDGPIGMHVDGINLYWTPELSSIGSLVSFTVAAIDLNGLRDEQTFSVPVVDNQPPYFSKEPALEAKAGREYVYRPTVVDPEGKATSFDIVDAPDDAYVSIPYGAVIWDIPADYSGQAAFTLVAADDKGAEILKSFTLEVEPNFPPVFGEILKLSITQDVYSTSQGTPYTVFVPISDPDGDGFSVVLTGPVGMTLSPTKFAGQNGYLVTWTPGAQEPIGPRSIHFVATDSYGAVGSLGYELNVLTNQPPVFTANPPPGVAVGVSYDWVIAASDPEGYETSLQLVEAPAGASLSSNNRLTWTPTTDQLGIQTIRIDATDSFGAINHAVFEVNVSPNGAPEFTVTPYLGARLNTTYLSEILAVDPEGESVTYQLLDGPNGLVVATPGVTIYEAARVQITPGEEGRFPVVIQASDPSGNFAIYEFELTVVGDNIRIIDYPKSPEVYAGRDYEYQLDALHPTGLPASYTLTQWPAGMNVSSGGVLSWQPTSGQIGDHEVIIRAESSDGQFDDVTVVFTVLDPGASPEFVTEPETLIYLGEAYSYIAQATDADGDPIRYQLTTKPDGMTIDALSGQLSWLPAQDQSGDHAVVIRASDELDNYSEQSYTLTVSEDREPPHLRYTPPDEAFVGQEYRYVPFAVDASGQAAQIEFVSGPEGMVYEDSNGSMTLLWTPFEGDCIEEVLLLLTDQFGTSVEIVFSITVHSAPKKLNRIQCSLDPDLCAISEEI